MTARKAEGKPANRKRRTIIEETLPPQTDTGDEPDELDINLESVEDTETLQDVLSQFGESQILFKVYQQTPTGQAFCFPCQPPIDEEFIQREWGGGDFVIRIYIDGRFRKSIPLKIAPRPRSLASNDNQLNPGAYGLGASDRKHSEFLERMILELITNKSAATPQGPSLTDLTTALSNLDGLRGKQENQMDLIMKGIELAQSFNGERDWKSEALGMVKTALPDVMSLLGRGGQPPKQPVAADGVPMVQEPSEHMLRAGIQYLKQLAISAVDPISIIELVYANAANPQYKPIIDAVLTKDFAYFVGLDPSIGSESFKPWFESVFNGLRSAFSPENQMDVDTPGDLGNASDTRNNGKPSAKRDPKPKGAAVSD